MLTQGENESSRAIVKRSEGETLGGCLARFPFPAGSQSLVVTDHLGNDEFNVYFDANGNGDLDFGDAQIQVIGLEPHRRGLVAICDVRMGPGGGPYRPTRASLVDPEQSRPFV